MKSKKRYSRRRYNGKRRTARKRYGIAILLIIVFVIAVVVFAVFLGKYLKLKADASADERNATGGTSDTGDIPGGAGDKDESLLYEAELPKRLESLYIASDELDAVLESGASGAYSLVMRNEKGELFYSSEAAQTIGSQAPDNGMPKIEELGAKLGEGNSYFSAFLSLSSHPGGVAALDALHAYEAALISELALAGFDEVIVCAPGKVGEETVRSLCGLSKFYRDVSETAVPLGVVLPYSFFLAENANELCRAIAECFEIIAVDYTDIVPEAEQSFYDAVEARIDSMQMYFSRYSLRAVLDHDNGQYSETLEALSDSAIYLVHSVLSRELFSSAEVGGDGSNADTGVAQ
ncbi:MAG: hypothetical protein IJ303_06275 [Clostridia bacterium]|nr:hypothetical protein [Clostridia bacterium]